MTMLNTWAETNVTFNWYWLYDLGRLNAKYSLPAADFGLSRSLKVISNSAVGLPMTSFYCLGYMPKVPLRDINLYQI